ncbi:hypothetical protein EIP86_007339 [Pleurotus ostreatoroseus]|nr:hypothetical protein EIP86_007339 [Pleurotus ostreatoroseus]
MALDPKQAVATLKGLIARKDPASLIHVVTISKQIDADLYTGRHSTISAAELVETPQMTQWLENDLHLVVVQILLDKKNYSKSTTDTGQLMRLYGAVSTGIVSYCCALLFARVGKCKTLYREQPTTQHAEKRDSAILHLGSIITQFQALWPLVWAECYDMGSTPLPVLRPDYGVAVRDLPVKYCGWHFECYDEPPAWIDNGPLIDILLANMVLDEAPCTVISAAYDALLLTLVCVEDAKPIIQYLQNSSISMEQAFGIATIFIAKICRDFTAKKSRIGTPSSPFVFLQALDEVHPIVVCAEPGGMSLITSVVHAWKHDLCTGGLTNVTYECIKFLTYPHYYGKEVTAHAALGIYNVYELFSWGYVTARDYAPDFPQAQGSRFLADLAQAIFRVSEPCMRAVQAYQTPFEAQITQDRDSKTRDTQPQRQFDLDVQDQFLDTFQKLRDLLEPHKPGLEDRVASPTSLRRSYGWRKWTGCFWRQCLCHNAKPYHYMKICKGCGLATYCSEHCQRKYV